MLLYSIEMVHHKYQKILNNIEDNVLKIMNAHCVLQCHMIYLNKLDFYEKSRINLFINIF